ncbi:MAG TPA: hypothetical protein VIH99_04075 [Bdellovibrionota bacterium]|jgi:hypothetical protein
MRLSIRTSILLALLLSPLAFAEKDDFVIYQPQRSSVEELKRAAEGVANGARINVFNNKLIVYGTSSQRAAVLRLFSELDQKLARFRVSVRVASRGNTEAEGHAIEGRVGNKNVNVGSRSGIGGRTGGVVVGNQNGSIGVSAGAMEAEAEGSTGQSVVVSDGGNAKIYGDPFPAAVSVYVRSAGKKIAHVEIRQAAASSAGAQALVTEIDLPLGKWRTIGGVSGSHQGQTGEILGSARQKASNSHDVQIKVEREEESD